MYNSTILHIRSKDCTQLTAGFNTDLQVNLNTSIGGPSSYLHLSLIDAQIPHTWFNISSQLSDATIQVDGADSLVLPQAIYDIYTLIDSVNANTKFPYTATFDESTTRVAHTNTDSTTHIINFATSRVVEKSGPYSRSTCKKHSVHPQLVFTSAVCRRIHHRPSNNTAATSVSSASLVTGPGFSTTTAE